MKIKELFKRKNKKKYPKDDYIRSELIYSSYNNFIILISFSDNYYQDVANFIASNCNTLKMKLAQSSYEVDTGKVDVDDEPITVTKNDNYLLIAGSPISYLISFENTDISNSILVCITKEIYENMAMDDFSKLIQDNILNERLFKIKNRKDINNMNLIYTNEMLQVCIEYNNIQCIMNKLPSVFTNYDVFNIIKLSYVNDITGRYRGSVVINDLLSPTAFIDGIRDDIIKTIFNGLVPNPNLISIRKLIDYIHTPIYKRVILDNDELLHGSINPSNLDELFQQRYDRFNAIANDNTAYVDIDEILSADDPEYDNLQEDKYGNSY